VISGFCFTGESDVIDSLRFFLFGFSFSTGFFVSCSSSLVIIGFELFRFDVATGASSDMLLFRVDLLVLLDVVVDGAKEAFGLDGARVPLWKCFASSMHVGHTYVVSLNLPELLIGGKQPMWNQWLQQSHARLSLMRSSSIAYQLSNDLLQRMK
jgi:hypothetical protein